MTGAGRAWAQWCVAAARAACCAALTLVVSSAWASDIRAIFIDSSKPTRCAEEDNLYVKLVAEGVRELSLSVEHPPYIGAVSTDSTAPDFTHCDMSGDPKFAFTPRSLTLFEDAKIRLVGHTFSNFWRPDVVDTRVGARSERGLHLLQLLRRGAKADIEILVLYPADGYWRAKPLPPPQLPDSAYGSSFLFGPIEEDQRPFVAIESIDFDPESLRFSLQFRDGSTGVLQVSESTAVRTRVRMVLGRASQSDRPFAALRSMFVTLDNADASVASWRDEKGLPRSESIIGFGRFESASARFGRDQPSRHNLSAPDHIFSDFSRQSVAR